jgi:hypothetical protein
MMFQLHLVHDFISILSFIFKLHNYIRFNINMIVFVYDSIVNPNYIISIPSSFESIITIMHIKLNNIIIFLI